MKKYIGDKAFYKMVLLIVIPMVVQQGITNLVNLVDNIMVGRLGVEAMSGVAIVNQLIFVFNVTVFGCISGASILGAQFFGMKDQEGLRYTFRFRLMASMIACIAAIGIFSLFGEPLIQLYLSEDGENVGNIALTMLRSKEYLKIIIIGLLPFVISQTYSSTLRDTGETFIPMVGSMIAVVVNLMLNYVLIFGAFGCPKLGVMGAAIATVIARWIEMLYIVIATHANAIRFEFIHKALSSMHIPFRLVKKIMITSLPLMANEFLWAMGMATIMQNYSKRGVSVVAAFNISSTVSNLFMIAFVGMGSVISILVGQQLGAGEIEKARDTDRKLMAFNVTCNIALGCILLIVAKFIPDLYAVDSSVVRELAIEFLHIVAIMLPLNAFNHGAYFTMRSGGRTFITFLFDSVYMWVVSIPITYILVRYTSLHIVTIYFLVQSIDFIKAIIGVIMLKSGVWARTIIHQ